MIVATACKIYGTLNCIEEFCLDGPRNLRIVEYEDRLECSADGNPTPTYRWTDVETNRSVEGPVLTLNFDKALDSDKELNFDCLATNALGTQRKSISQLNNGLMFFPDNCFLFHNILMSS